MEKLRLLHILYSGQGGLGTYFINFVKNDESGLFQHYAFFYGIEELYPEYRNFCNENGIPYKVVGKVKKLSLIYIRELKQFTKKQSIDAVVFHTFSVTPAFFFLPGIKKVAIDHTPVQVKTRMEWFYTFLLHKYADVFIFFYKEQFEALKKKFSFAKPERNTLYLPKSVDTNEFVPALNRSDTFHETFRIGMSARLISGKRYDILLEAIALLKSQGISVHCTIAGSGPQLEMLKIFVERLGIGSLVEFAGVLSRTEMVRFYQSLNAYIHMTDGETVCYCIMEAQSCALPIIASDVSGVNNVLNHEDSALLVLNEISSLATAVARLISDKKLQTHLSGKSRELALKSRVDVCDQVFKMLMKKTI